MEFPPVAENALAGKDFVYMTNARSKDKLVVKVPTDIAVLTQAMVDGYKQVDAPQEIEVEKVETTKHEGED